jgi:hypothetical protein
MEPGDASLLETTTRDTRIQEKGWDVEAVTAVLTSEWERPGSAVLPIWSRVAEAARIGGATAEDLLTIGFLLNKRVPMKVLLDSMRPLADARRKQQKALAEKKSRVTPAERERLLAENLRLTKQYPKPGIRYRAIAERHDLNPDRVRYVIEGPRRSKK